MPEPATPVDPFVSGLARVLEPAGWDLLQSLPPYEEADALALGSTLRAAGHDPELVAAALTQSRLRRRAEEKFGEFAQRMLLTPAGLEQATRLSLAALHARRFLDAGLAGVVDAGCGIGGDAMAAAALGLDVLAVDHDPATVAVATVNLQPFDRARAELGDAEQLDLAAVRDRDQGIWMDPARRTTGGSARRLYDPEDCSPPLSQVRRMARELGEGTGQDGPLGVKLGPGIAHNLLPPNTETQWISWYSQVLEADCWFGPLARPGISRSALVIDAAGAHRLDDAADPEAAAAPVPTGELGAFLHEPDGAVIRAGLLGVLAARTGAHTLDPTIAYLSTDAPVADALWRSYEVLDSLPFSLKRLGAYLREHRLGILEIKKRGTAVEPEELRRRLRPRRFGDGAATVILTRIGGEQHAVIARPVQVGS